MENSPQLRVDSIYVRRQGRIILNSVFLTLQKNEILGVVGHNGSGKSSLFSVIFGSLRPDYGNLFFEGKQYKNGYRNQLIGLLPQNKFLSPNATIEQLFQIFEIPPDICKEKAIFGDGSRKVCDLSGGERRFLEVVLILFNKCKIAILDEPFTGLSPLKTLELSVYIKNASKFKSIIISDHRYEELISICDRLLVMNQGNIFPVNSRDDLILRNYINF